MLVYEQVLFNLYHTLELLLGGTVVVLSGSFSRFEEHRTVTAKCPGGPLPLFLLEYKKKNPSKCFGLLIAASPHPTPTNFKPSYRPDEEVGRAADAFELILDFAEKPPF